MPVNDSFDPNAPVTGSPSIETDANGRASLHPIEPDGDADPFAIISDDEHMEAAAREKQRPSLIWEITETLVLALFIFVAVRSVVLNFRVDGLSMEPSLDSGQMLLVNRQIYFNFDVNNVLNLIPFVDREDKYIIYPLHPPQRGDIVVFDPPVNGTTKPYIKRVIGLSGERITIHDGSVFIDGTRLDEPYLNGTATSWPSGDPNYEVVVPEGHLFLMGDNRNNSTDSRSFGPVDQDALIGRAWISYWPSQLAGILQTPDYVE